MCLLRSLTGRSETAGRAAGSKNTGCATCSQAGDAGTQASSPAGLAATEPEPGQESQPADMRNSFRATRHTCGRGSDAVTRLALAPVRRGSVLPGGEGRFETLGTSCWLCQTYFANWKMSKTNFSIFIPFGLSGLMSCPWESTYGIFF